VGDYANDLESLLGGGFEGHNLTLIHNAMDIFLYAPKYVRMLRCSSDKALFANVKGEISSIVLQGIARWISMKTSKKS